MFEMRWLSAFVLNSPCSEQIKVISDLISSTFFRPYLSNDIVGSQVCGSMKNVYAIACGIISGKKFGENAVASIYPEVLLKSHLCVKSWVAKQKP